LYAGKIGGRTAVTATVRWSIRSIIAFAALIGVTATGYALMVVAYHAVIRIAT
jgi:hypothetical protein